MLDELIRECRSFRRFDESDRIGKDTLLGWVDTARNVASSCNSQPLRYALITSEDACARVFDCCAWAGSLPDWDGPEPGERPSAYIIICSDAYSEVSSKCTAWDTGIAAQSIMLQAVEAGFGGCMIAAFARGRVSEICHLPRDVQPELVLALGKPVEEVRIVGPREGGNLKYYRDSEGTHYVPKRPLDEVVIGVL